MCACYTLYAFRSSEEVFPEIATSECFHHPFAQYAVDVRDQRSLTKHGSKCDASHAKELDALALWANASMTDERRVPWYEIDFSPLN